MTPAGGERSRGRPFPAGLAVCAALITGCQTATPIAPVDLARSDWHIRTGQAVWTAAKGAEPLSGDLVLATRPGELWLEFAKPPFSLVIARHTTERWQLARPLSRESRSGNETPPADNPWFLLPVALSAGPLPADWQFEQLDLGAWRLRHPVSGETLEGYLSP